MSIVYLKLKRIKIYLLLLVKDSAEIFSYNMKFVQLSRLGL